MPFTPIEKFEVIYSANTFVPRIGLMNSGKFVAQLLFLPDGKPLPPDGIINGQINLYYHVEDFDNVIELLRDETPVYLLYSGSGPGFENAITTSPEPVGQGVKKAA